MATTTALPPAWSDEEEADDATTLTGPRVLAVVGEVDAVTTVWRVLWPVSELQRRGYPTGGQVGDPTHPFHVLQAILQRPERPDALLLPRSWWQRCGAPGDVPRWCDLVRRAGLTLIAEYDDDLFEPRGAAAVQAMARDLGDTPAPRWFLETMRQRYITSVQQSDGVTVSTPALAAVVRQHTRPGAPVVVVPNAIDPADYLTAPFAPGPRLVPPGPLTIGWAGTRRNAAIFRETGVLEAWGRIARRYPQVRFVVVGHMPLLMSGYVPSERVIDLGPLGARDYPRGLHCMDIACCPLHVAWDTVSKSPQKSWEHALCGAAVVASPTVYGDPAVNPGYVDAGGLLADGADEWEHHLSRLLESPDERHERVRTLQRWVLAEHTLQANVGRWVEAWRAIVAGGPPRSLPSTGGSGGQYDADRARQKAKAKAKRRR